MRFHTQTTLSDNCTQPLTDYLDWVRSLLPHDKYELFKALFRFPLKTNEVTAICFDKLSRIFDGRNPVYNYQFTSTEERDDWEWYRQEILHEPEIWATKGWEHFKTDINSVLVVDMPTERNAEDEYPEPYFYWLSIDNVIDYQVNEQTGNMDYIIFKQPNDKIAVVDDEYYRVYADDNNDAGTLLVESAHGLGYCPCRFFWNVPMSLTDPDVKESPLTKQLEALDWYLFYALSKKHLDMYGSYPIYSGYEQNCDYSNAENGDYCDGGFLKNKVGEYIHDANGLMLCPKCGNKRRIGVGSYVEIPIPSDEQPDLRNPVQMLSADVASLEYNVAECKRLKDDIISAVVGVDSEIVNSQALNEMQISANFESQSTILNRVKKGFEDAQKFVDETICRLRYGNAFISARVNYGTEFFILSATELRNRYKVAKESGASEAELDALQEQILATEYRNNPTQMQRMLVLADIEPYRHLTREEVIALYKDGFATEEEMKIKIDFANIIRRFERENLNVLEFGNQTDYVNKIETIKKTLVDYVS